MCSWRRIISFLMILCVVLSCCGCGSKSTVGRYSVSGTLVGVVDVEQLASNRFTQLESDGQKPLPNYGLEGYKLVCENENLALYINENVASVRVVNKSNGYVWGALATEDPENLNDTWGGFAQSVVSISYMDKTGATKLMGAGSEKAKRKYKYLDNGFTCSVDFGNKVDITLDVTVTLEQDRLHFAVDDETIKENGKNYVEMLYFIPFMGSTVADENDGYLFVPDGSGALIRYQKPKNYLKTYSERVYGLDYAIDNLNELNDLKSNRPIETLKENSTVTMPVFGVTHGVNANALFGRISSGDSYAYINASPAGVVTDYNWATASFVYRQVYSQPTSKNGAGVPVVQKTRNTVNPELDMYFLSGNEANYSGMAAKYREILKEDGKLENNIGKTDTQLFLDFVAADIEKQAVGSSEKIVTNLEYLKKAVEVLNENDVDKVALSILGWQKNGLSGYRKSDIFKKTVIGDFGDLSKLKDLLSKNGGELSLYSDPLRAKEIQINSRVDSAITLSQSPICDTAVDAKEFLGDTWYLKIDVGMKYLKEQFDLINKNKISLAIDGGNLLYGEYLIDDFVSREQNKKFFAEKIAEISKAQGGLTLYNPNEYLLPYVSVYRNIPTSCNQEIYMTDSVPFIQMVLSGNMVLVAPYANENFYSKIDLLKCVEYNMYPSFILTEEVNLNLDKTTLKGRVSTCFDNWKDTICDIDSFVGTALSNVRGKQILRHQRLNETVFKVSYENGDMYINYGKESFKTPDGSVAEPESFCFCEVE